MKLPNLLKSKSLYLKIAGFFAGCALILFLLDVWVMPAYTNYDEGVTVPDVSRLSLAEAESLLTSYGLRYEVTDRRSNAAFPANYVIDQTPSPAEIVKPNRKVYLTVNTVSNPTVVVPEVLNLSLRNARIQLQNYGLELGAVSFESSRFKSSVLRQSIAPGDTVAKGTVVDLTVSDGLGERMVEIPEIVGLPLTEAQQKLREAGLRAGELRFMPSREQPPNVILDYTPREEEVVEGETLMLIVSEQPDTLEEDGGGYIDTSAVSPPDSTRFNP